MNTGILRISGELLHDVLQLPKDAKVLRFRESPDLRVGIPDLDIVIEHPEMPVTPKGCLIKVMSAYCTKLEDDTVQWDWSE